MTKTELIKLLEGVAAVVEEVAESPSEHLEINSEIEASIEELKVFNVDDKDIDPAFWIANVIINIQKK